MFPLEEAILEVMASIENPKDEVMHQSSFPYSEQTRVDMMSCDPRLGAFSREPSTPPSLDPFPPWLSFSKLSTELFSTPYIKYLHFLLPSCLLVMCSKVCYFQVILPFFL